MGESTASFLQGQGVVRALLRQAAWQVHPLGAPESWPAELRFACGLIFDSAVPMLVMWGPDQRLVYNDAYVEVLADKHPMALGAPLAEVWPEVMERVGPLVARVLEGESFHFENAPFVLVRHGLPETAWFDFSYNPLRIAEAGIGGVLAIITETTRQMQAAAAHQCTEAKLRETANRQLETEEALRATRQRLEATLIAADIGTWNFDIRNNRVYADENMARMFGVAPADADGGPAEAYFAVVHPDDRPDAEQHLADALKRRGAYIDDYRIRDAAGHWRHIHARGRVEVGADGEPAWLPGVVLDITARKEAELALAKSEANFRTLADNIPQLAWMANPDGWIFWYNNRWLEYTGTTLEEVQGDGWRKIVHPEHVAATATKLREHIASGAVWEDTFPMRGKDGRYRWFLSRAVPIRDAHGRITRWFGTNTDVTVQREAEEALREIDKRKDEFLAMLAHELRNPLAPIAAAADLLQRMPDDPQRIAQIGAVIARQTGHMRSLIDELLDVSRVNRGLVSLEREPVDITTLVNEAIEQTRPLIEARHHNLQVQIDTQCTLVEGDKKRLIQVLANLLNNAAKYTPEGGRIHVRVHGGPGTVRIAVSDTGQGMDAALQAHAFELFTQGERTPDRSQGGLGIGLALVKSLVQLHGGRVTAASEGPGRGSEFAIILPCLEELELQSATHPAPPLVDEGGTAQAIDDANRPAAVPPPPESRRV